MLGTGQCPQADQGGQWHQHSLVTLAVHFSTPSLSHLAKALALLKGSLVGSLLSVF